jgi:hypothetical protein
MWSKVLHVKLIKEKILGYQFCKMKKFSLFKIQRHVIVAEFIRFNHARSSFRVLEAKTGAYVLPIHQLSRGGGVGSVDAMRSFLLFSMSTVIVVTMFSSNAFARCYRSLLLSLVIGRYRKVNSEHILFQEPWVNSRFEL